MSLQDSYHPTCPFVSLDGDNAGKTSRSLTTAIILINCIFLMTTSTSNVLTVYVIMKKTTLRSSNNIFLASQATSSIVVFLLAHPTLIALLIDEVLDNSGKHHCAVQVLNLSASVSCILLSFLSVLGMAFDQFLALQSPSRHTTSLTTRNITVMAISVWLFITFTSIVSAVFGIALIFFLIGIMAATVVMSLAIGFNIKSYLRIRKYVMQVQQQLETPNATFPGFQPPDIARHKKNAALVACIMATCLVTHIPLFSTFIFAFITGWTASTKTAYMILLTIAYSSCSLNAASYFRWNKEVRREVLNIFNLN